MTNDLEPSTASETPPFFGGPRPRPRDAGRALTVFFATCLLVGSGMVALNMVVDPRGEFPANQFRPVTQNTLELKLDLLRAYGEPPETVILGSSNTQRIDPAAMEAAGFGPTFNMGIGGATLDTVDAIARYLLDDDERRPQNLVVGLDLRMMRADDRGIPALSTVPELRPYVANPLSTTDFILWALYYSTSKDYLEDSLRVLWYAMTEYPASNTADWGPDGAAPSVLHGEDTDRLSFPDRDVDAWRVTHAGLGAPHASRAQQLLDLIQLAGEHGVELTLFYTPMAPRTLELLRAATPLDDLRASMTSRLAALCDRVETHDFLEVEAFGGDPSRFTTPVHYVGESAPIATALATGQGSICEPN